MYCCHSAVSSHSDRGNLRGTHGFVCAVSGGGRRHSTRAVIARATLSTATETYGYQLKSKLQAVLRSPSGTLDEALKVYAKLRRCSRAPLPISLYVWTRAPAPSAAYQHVNIAAPAPPAGFTPHGTIDVDWAVFRYNELLNKCVAEQRVDVAETLTERMIETNVQPDEGTFITLIRAAAMARNLELGFGLLKDMQRAGVRARLRAYAPLLDVAVSGDSSDVAFSIKVWRHMRSHGVEPSEKQVGCRSA